MRKVALAILFIAALWSIGASGRYLFTSEFMPYHAVVAGTNWAQLEPGMQAIILGMLRIVGAGFLACGVALLWLLVPLSRGETWPRWAALSVAAAAWVPTLGVTLALAAASPDARPPVVPSVIMLGLVVVGVGALFLVGRSPTPAAQN